MSAAACCLHLCWVVPYRDSMEWGMGAVGPGGRHAACISVVLLITYRGVGSGQWAVGSGQWAMDCVQFCVVLQGKVKWGQREAASGTTQLEERRWEGRETLHSLDLRCESGGDTRESVCVGVDTRESVLVLVVLPVHVDNGGLLFLTLLCSD